MKICRGLGCTSTELIKAHIIPQSFGRYVERNSGPNVMLSADGLSRKTPRGLFDTGILCASCDGYLNKKYDVPAFRLFKSFDLASTKIIDLNPTKYHGVPPFFEASGVDCDMLCGFIGHLKSPSKGTARIRWTFTRHTLCPVGCCPIHLSSMVSRA